MKLYLLLTGTIDSGKYNNTGNIITNINERLSQYESAISRYITETPFTDIVFIENSNYPFDSERFINLAHNYNKRFEFLSGKICKEATIKKGKSFGDAYLIYEAVTKSELLNECEFFYKITGRIFLKNAKQICKTAEKHRNEFIIYTGMGWCLTNIFKINRQDYINVLLDVYKDCDEKTTNDIEISFYKRLTNSTIPLDSFTTYPYFEGRMGATGRNYSGNSLIRFIRNVLAQIHCFKYNSKTSFLVKLMMKITNKKSYI